MRTFSSFALGGGCLVGLAVLLLAMVAVVTHGLKLGHLIGGQDARHLLLRLFINGAHLLVAVLRGELRILAQSLDLLIMRSEDGLDFHSLVRGKVQFAAEVLGLLLGVGGMVVLALHGSLLRVLRRLRRLRLLREGSAAAEREGEGGGKDEVFHVSRSCDGLLHSGYAVCECRQRLRQDVALLGQK